MNRKNRTLLADRVAKAAEAALAARRVVSAVDILVGIGWLDTPTVERWRRGQVDYLERDVRTTAAGFGSHEAVPILGNRERAEPKPNRVCRA
jgi:hypothetical protein